MHPNPAFRTASRDQNIAFSRARGFGQLSINGGFGPLAAHVPFVLDDDGGQAFLHLARSNPILAAVDQPLPALLTVSGPDAYVSPDWYGAPDQVPTWNYVAVHLRGSLERLPDARLAEVLDLQTAVFETRLAPKSPWQAEKMDAEVRTRMMRAIVPLRMTVDEVHGTWKLSQNKADTVRRAAAGRLADTVGQETGALAELMREFAHEAHDSMDSRSGRG